MSSQHTSTDSSTDSSTDTTTAHCGHEVSRDAVHYFGELPLCESCYLDKDRAWFGVDDYPTVLRQTTYTTHGRGGPSTVTSFTTLVGISEDRQAVYHNADDGQLWYVAPRHSDFHDTDGPLRSSLRDRDIDATQGAPAKPSDSFDFHTMPNGDHLALLKVEDAPDDLDHWLHNSDTIREVSDRYTE